MRKIYSVISALIFLHLGVVKAQISSPAIVVSDYKAVAPSHRTLEVTARVSSSTICYGDSTTLSCTPTGGLPPYTYNWTPITGLACPTCQNSKTSTPISTVYTITVTDRLANTASATVSITVDPVLNLTLSSSATNPCKGNVVYLTASATGGTTPYTYSWTPAAPLNAANIYNPYYTAITNKTFTCKVTDAFGCTITASIIENIDDLDVTVTNQKICPNTTTSLTANVSGANALPPYTYSWMPGGQTNQTATGLSAGTYSVTVSDANGCSTIALAHITLYPAAVFNAAANLASLIAGDSVTATGGTPPYTYSFAPAIVSGGILTLPTVTMTFTLTVTDSNGCSSSDTAKFIPTPDSAGACGAIFISEYIQDSANHDDGIELYNPTAHAINLSTYYLGGTTNGSLFAPPFIIKLHGTIGAHKTFLIANALADTALTHKAKLLTDSLNFGGKDIVALAHIVPTRTYVNFTLIDMVGSISILPATNGWPVGSGSTKNHTLIRNPMVTEGDPNWLTCRYQWSVYPRGTFSNIGHFKSACSPTDPDLTFTLVNLPPNCDNPNYFNFAVMASSVPNSILNSCDVEFKYPAGEYYATAGSDVTFKLANKFTPVPGDNDYNTTNIFNSADTVIGISLGTMSDSSPHGVVLTSIPDTVFIVSFLIKDCNPSGNISFADADTAVDRTLSYYASPDSTIASINRIDSMKTSINTIFYLCTQYDSLLNCIDSVAIDTIWNYSIDTVFNYNYTYMNFLYNNTTYVGSINPLLCSLSILPFSKPINAGTNNRSIPAIPSIKHNSSILPIYGSGFGSKRGIIKVSNANDTGMINLDTLDILKWSSGEILVKMPSVILDTNVTVTPGSGPMEVFNSCGAETTTNLQINYNLLNWNPRGTLKLMPDIVMENTSESFLFKVDSSVANNPSALACVKKALRTWNCYTGVNWKLVGDTMGDSTGQDGISVLYFSNNFSVTDTAELMSTTSWYNSCYSFVDSVAFTDEADTKMRRVLPFGARWDYDTTGRIDTGNVYYFYDAILHELGHSHGLGHINDLMSLMYRLQVHGFRESITTGSSFPGPATLLGALDMVYTSASPTNTPYNLGCAADSILIPDSKGCVDSALSVHDIHQTEYKLNLYPNPIDNGSLTITYEITENSYIQLKIVDCTGRELILLNDEHKSAGTYNEYINTDGLAAGIYLFYANINGACQTIKFIKI